MARQETDDIEKWLDREFETPAEEALQKATSGGKLSPDDWVSLVRFLAAQDVRTPARLLERLQRWRASLPRLMDETLREAVRALESAEESGTVPPHRPAAESDPFPCRITTRFEPGMEHGDLEARTVAGRALWLWEIRGLLSRTAAILHQHRWTILRPPEGSSWFTSDDPVIKLNYYGDGTYDLKGGWGNPGTEILLPLSPQHLLYTKIGERPARRGQRVQRAHAELIRRFVAEHAHRMIFAATQDPEVPKLRPRIVSATLCREEAEQWRRWHEEQTAAELELMKERSS